LQQLRSGDSEAAFHNLIELDPDVLPTLIAAFQEETSAEFRSSLLRVIDEFRSPVALSAFASALRDRRPEVWRAALNGLVSLKSPAAAELLAQAVVDEGRLPMPDREFLDWLQEAHQQAIEAYAQAKPE
jgi:HEAT repeat protein